MRVHVAETKGIMAESAASRAAELLRAAIAEHGSAALILATGASQFEMLDILTRADLAWDRVTVYHLDEYIGLAETHPASFRRYLRERFVDRVTALGAFVPVEGDAPDPTQECRRLGELISRVRVDVACIGIGENGHLAFNDPPADFGTEEPYLVVNLDHACRRQQWGEGWFATLDEVPKTAISMSVRQLLDSNELICIVPESRKAKAVQATLEGPITPMVPASILRTHPNTTIYLDRESSALLRG